MVFFLTRLFRFSGKNTASSILLLLLVCAARAETDHYASGLRLMDDKHYAEAISSFEKHLDNNPEDSRTLNNIGFAYYKQGNLKNAEAYCRQAVKADDKYSVAYNNLGIALYHQEKYEGAKKNFEKAIELNPLYAKAMINLGLIYLQAGDKKTSKEWYQKAKAADKEYVGLRRKSAEVKDQKGELNLPKK